MRKLLLVLIGVLIFSNSSFAKCLANPSTAIRIWLESIMTIYNVFPIRIANVPIGPSFGLPDYSDVGSPICICKDPLPRVGITVSLWEPIAFVEVVKDPFCFPSLGVQLDLAGRFKVNQHGRSAGIKGEEQYTYDAHWVKAHPFADHDAMSLLLHSLVIPDTAQAKVIRIANTLDLNEVEVSEAYAAEVAKRDNLEELIPAADWNFNKDGNLEDLL